MSIFHAIITIGPLMLTGALPAVATTPDTQFAATTAVSEDRSTYLQKAEDQMREWQRKLEGFGKNADAKGKEADTAAKNDLNNAWIKTKAESRKLQSAGDANWDAAKASFEQATADLAKEWRKIHPEDK